MINLIHSSPIEIEASMTEKEIAEFDLWFMARHSPLGFMGPAAGHDWVKTRDICIVAWVASRAYSNPGFVG